jgi:hypothetical protein
MRRSSRGGVGVSLLCVLENSEQSLQHRNLHLDLAFEAAELALTVLMSLTQFPLLLLTAGDHFGAKSQHPSAQVGW